MIEPAQITPEIVRAHGISEDEYARILEILGRAPTFTELGIFSVMWSEHCSYKNSKPVLKTFPTSAKNVLVKAGEENAGIIDIGDGIGICFKVESHNHPSAVEPFQGAATGVGGIIRDIFTMGARPVLLLNSLRFGPLDRPSVKRLFTGVVSGIAHYGNCIGIPTVGGEVVFDPSYEGNPLVNVMCLGVVRKDQIAKAAASGLGNPVYYVGSTTGRDGLGGASFASRELTEESERDRPAVQVGDPFTEKLLLEACLEILRTGAVVGIQDMGAAGLTCSCCETASKGNTGVEIDVTRVPKRETGMIPYEIMLSESQERMLMIVDAARQEEAVRVFTKWDLHATPIGTVTGDGMMTVKENGRVVARIPARKIADDAPVYHREARRPAYLDRAQELDLRTLPEPADFNAAFARLLQRPTIASKQWVYEQYDHMVLTNTEVLPGSDSAVIRIKDSTKRVAVSIDGNGRYCYLDPFEGGKICVAESARNVVCSGAQPQGITDCLNFGNPMDPEIFWQLRECARGITAACQALELPVTGGNVSLYNESPAGAIHPTPVIGTVGVIDSGNKPCTQYFRKPGDVILLLGRFLNELGGSEYLAAEHGLTRGLCPRLDLDLEARLQRLTLQLIREGLAASAHDCSDGGLAVALAESCVSGPRRPLLGADVDVALPSGEALRTDSVLFGETQSRIVLSVDPESLPAVLDRLRAGGLEFHRLGTVTAAPVLAVRVNGAERIRMESQEIFNLWSRAIPDALGLSDSTPAR